MSLRITAESPLSAEARALLDGSENALRQVYTPDECFTFAAEELARPQNTFFIARRNGAPAGCIALCDCGKYAEIKRLFVRPEARGTGTGRALVRHLETAARKAGHHQVRLETGPRLAAGVALYRALGYTERGPFGDYAAHPASLFMEKAL